MTHELTSIEDLRPAPYNPREIEPEAAAGLKASVTQFGDLSGIVWNSRSGHLVSGHQRVEALQGAGAVFVIGADEGTFPNYFIHNEEEFPVRIVDWDEPTERAANVTANNPHIGGGFVDDGLQAVLASIQDEVPVFEELRLDFLLDPEGGKGYNSTPTTPGSLSDSFGVPPFSVLDARQGYWQSRKRKWMSIGIASGNGRASDLQVSGKTGCVASMLEKSDVLSWASIFDPVLCEALVRWFSSPSGTVLDPFAGGSVRGIVSGLLGREYVGFDIRKEQIEANKQQANAMSWDKGGDSKPRPRWIHGDAREAMPEDLQADFILSCPPYFDLEVYSDDPRDLSTMGYDEFLKAYKEIITTSCAQLKENRFACFVVGEVRNKKSGIYRNFVAETIKAFTNAGLAYYNEIVLVTSPGTVPLRARRLFTLARKVGKCHQNVLVFVKGDPKKATEACGEIDLSFLDEMEPGEE